MRTFFIYDGINVVGEFNVGAAMSAWQMWGPNGLVARRKMLVNNNPGWTAAATSYSQYDPRGNLVHQLSTTGTVDEDYGHTAYGERVAEGSTVTFGRSDGPVGYGGQFGYQTDPETGLILCGFRYYDPKNGRWLTRDPIGYAGGVNLYSYVGNNPPNHVDPQGLVGPLLVPIAMAVSAGGWMNLGSQLLFNPNHQVDGGELAIAASTSGIFAFAAPLGVGVKSGAALGATANFAQYQWVQYYKGEPTTRAGCVVSLGTGALGGAIGGKLAPYKPVVRPRLVINLDRANTQRAVDLAITIRDMNMVHQSANANASSVGLGSAAVSSPRGGSRRNSETALQMAKSVGE